MDEPIENKGEISQELAVQLAGIQRDLYAHILCMVPMRHEAEDLLQNTNRAILKKAEVAAEVKFFLAWAKKVAYYEVLAWRKTVSRDRHVFVNDAFLNHVAEESNCEGRSIERYKALDLCRKSLSTNDQELLNLRYNQGYSSQKIAVINHSSDNSVRQMLFRIRNRLLRCIQKRMAGQGELA